MLIVFCCIERVQRNVSEYVRAGRCISRFATTGSAVGRGEGDELPQHTTTLLRWSMSVICPLHRCPVKGERGVWLLNKTYFNSIDLSLLGERDFCSKKLTLLKLGAAEKRKEAFVQADTYPRRNSTAAVAAAAADKDAVFLAQKDKVFALYQRGINPLWLVDAAAASRSFLTAILISLSYSVFLFQQLTNRTFSFLSLLLNSFALLLRNTKTRASYAIFVAVFHFFRLSHACRVQRSHLKFASRPRARIDIFSTKDLQNTLEQPSRSHPQQKPCFSLIFLSLYRSAASAVTSVTTTHKARWRTTISNNNHQRNLTASSSSSSSRILSRARLCE